MVKENTSVKYYALWDKQTSRYLASGLNSTSEDDLKEAILSYLSVDHTDEELKRLSKLDIYEIASIYEFIVEDSKEPFEEEVESED